MEQSWRLYQLQALVFNLSAGFDDHVCRRVRTDLLEFIVQSHPKRIWLYVKHLRWMTSAEYAMLRDNFIGTAPIHAAKTRALMTPGTEDDIVRGELLDVGEQVLPIRNSTLIPDPRKLRGRSSAFIISPFCGWSGQRLPLRCLLRKNGAVRNCL